MITKIIQLEVVLKDESLTSEQLVNRLATAINDGCLTIIDQVDEIKVTKTINTEPKQQNENQN